MTDTNPTSPSPQEQLDLLISRIADGEASGQDWTTFAALAEKHPAAWKHLAQAQRDHQALSLAVGVALHAADHVELPSRHAADAFLRRGRAPEHRLLWSRLGRSSGWAVAAVLALMWITIGPGLRAGSVAKPDAETLAGLGYYPVRSAEDALALYRQRAEQNGRLVRLGPDVLLESRPAPTGNGFEVVYMRQMLEKTRVENLMRFAQDEAGHVVPVRVSVPDQPGQPE